MRDFRRRCCQSAGIGRVHDFGAAGDGGEGQATAQRFRGDEESGSTPKCSEANHFTGAADAGLHFVGDEEDAVLVGRFRGSPGKIPGRDDKTAFAKHGLRR